jgi:hypothetical protein
MHEVLPGTVLGSRVGKVEGPIWDCSGSSVGRSKVLPGTVLGCKAERSYLGLYWAVG